MTTSEHVNEIAAALAKAQAGMKNAALNKVNPHFKNRYADLAGIRDAVVPQLAANGIAVVQALGGNEASGNLAMFTRLVHASGQWMESMCPIPFGQDMQKMGSAITYARRYSLSAICGISADDDDDAEVAVRSHGNGHSQRVELPPQKADQFDQAWTDLVATADNGKAALDDAFAKQTPAFKNFVVTQRRNEWAAVQAKAKQVRTQ